MALAKFLSATTSTLLDSKLVLSGATAINVVPWTYSGGTWTLNPAATTIIPLESIVADSLAISQDDPETNNIDCETSDSPIKSVTTQGAWNITMTCADIQRSIVTALLGFEAVSSTGTTGTDYILAPNSTLDKYVAIEIVFGDTASLVCPKVHLTSKIDATNLKTETVKCTISGTMEEYQIGSSSKKTPFFINQKAAGG